MKNGRILIVEDESIVALDIKNRLASMGYSIVGLANNGEQAIALAKETEPD